MEESESSFSEKTFQQRGRISNGDPGLLSPVLACLYWSPSRPCSNITAHLSPCLWMQSCSWCWICSTDATMCCPLALYCHQMSQSSGSDCESASQTMSCVVLWQCQKRPRTALAMGEHLPVVLQTRASALGTCLDPVTGKVSRLYKTPLGLVFYILRYMKDA